MPAMVELGQFDLPSFVRSLLPETLRFSDNASLKPFLSAQGLSVIAPMIQNVHLHGGRPNCSSPRLLVNRLMVRLMLTWWVRLSFTKF